MKFFPKSLLILGCIILYTFCTSATVLETGAKVPELDLKGWITGKPVNLADLNGKEYAVLFFWTIGQRSLDAFPKITAIAKKFEGKKIKFIGIAPDTPESVEKFLKNQPLPFPVATDNILQTLYAYMRNSDQVPLVAIIDKSSILLWRGRTESLEEVLNSVLSGKFDLKANIEREKFSQAVMNALKIKDHPTALKLIDSELTKHPDNLELILLKINLTGIMMDDISTAEKTADAGLKQLPRNLKIYDAIIRTLRQTNSVDKLSTWFDRLIADYGDQPVLLVRYARQELEQPVGKVRVENAYKLTQAAYNAPKFENNLQKALIAREYAGVLYYCGRPDKALELAKISMLLLKDSKNLKEQETAKNIVNYYHTVIRLSQAIQ